MVGSNEDKSSSIRNADKLLQLSAKNNLSLNKILSIFKGSAPTLYNVLETKIRGPINVPIRNNNNLIRNNNNPIRNNNNPIINNNRNYNNMMYGGNSLDKLRADIGRLKVNTELNKLRKEIYNIRNNLI